MLFKYMTFNDRSKKIVMSNILANRLYFNSFLDYNDPFELFPVFEIKDVDRKRLKLKLVGKYDSKLMDMLEDEYINEILRMGSREKNSNSRYGITCFSRKNDNLLMWAHYADCHRGICLEFAINGNEAANVFIDYRKSALYPIKYQGKFFPMKYVDAKERPKFAFHESDDKHGYPPICMKSNDWSYEEEVRLMIRTDELYQFPRTLVYKDGLLKSVICGCNMSLENFVEICACVGRMADVRLKASILKNESYMVDIVEISYEEIECIKRNFKQLLSNFTEIEKYDIFQKFRIQMSVKEFYQYWNAVIRAIPLYLALRELECLSQLDIKAVMKDGPIIYNKVDRESVGAFLFYMQDEIEYLRNKK